MKRIFSMLKVALKSILRNRMRSLLTSLGIIIGVSAVIIMVAVGEGSQAKIEESISSLGSNMLIISPGSNKTSVSAGAGTFNKLTLEDAEILKEQGTYFNIVTPIVYSNAQMIGGSGNWRSMAYGVNPDFFELREWGTIYGDIFTERELKTKAKVAVLGKTVADNLFENEDPTGKMIRIGKTPVKVIGVLKEKGQSGVGQDQDDIVILPSTTVMYRLSGKRRVNMIQVGANSKEEISLAEEEIKSILRSYNKLPESGSADNFEVKTMDEITEMATSSSRVMTMLLAAIASVSLLVGGIGIMNIMLVSVTERTREIGIRISIGARTTDIMLQFILEAIILSVFGGVVGVLISLGAIFVMQNYFAITAVINPFVILVSVGFSAFVGIFFGFYPAKKASALNPIDALRTE